MTKIIKPDFDHEFYLVQLKTEELLKVELDLLKIDAGVVSDNNSDVVEVEDYIKEIRSKRAIFHRPYDMSIQLRGSWESGQVWLFDGLVSPVPSMQLRTHSLDGFSWGSMGPGAAQLSLALCLELFGVHRALFEYQRFKRDYIAPLPQSNFEIDLPIRFRALPIEVVVEVEEKQKRTS